MGCCKSKETEGEVTFSPKNDYKQQITFQDNFENKQIKEEKEDGNINNNECIIQPNDDQNRSSNNMRRSVISDIVLNDHDKNHIYNERVFDNKKLSFKNLTNVFVPEPTKYDAFGNDIKNYEKDTEDIGIKQDIFKMTGKLDLNEKDKDVSFKMLNTNITNNQDIINSNPPPSETSTKTVVDNINEKSGNKGGLSEQMELKKKKLMDYSAKRNKIFKNKVENEASTSNFSETNFVVPAACLIENEQTISNPVTNSVDAGSSSTNEASKRLEGKVNKEIERLKKAKNTKMPIEQSQGKKSEVIYSDKINQLKNMLEIHIQNGNSNPTENDSNKQHLVYATEDMSGRLDKKESYSDLINEKQTNSKAKAKMKKKNFNLEIEIENKI